MRVLAETIQPIAPETAKKLEQLRYTSYTLEKDIILFAQPAEKFRHVKLYVLINADAGGDCLKLAAMCIEGGADCLQLRAKDISDSDFLALGRKFVRLCGDAGVVSIINDRVDIAIASEADGVHFGQGDLPIGEARKMQLKPLIFGKSTHSMSELHQAIAEKPHYIALGSIFPTATKDGVSVVGTEYITRAIEALTAEPMISNLAIGGITLENLDSVLQAGAKAIAVSSSVSSAVKPTAVCKELKKRVTSFRR